MIRSLFILFALLSICSSTFAIDAPEMKSETAEELLLFYDWEELVTTASKRSQKIVEAPSPIYVFTAEDIQRTGVRNLMELVKFIPGFYVYPRLDQTFVIANRGLRSDQNDKILFLVDGMPLNNIAQDGAVNAHIFPDLDMVKRVEVISGPGSTMWGSDASLGIISIITKDGKDVDGNTINIDVATEDNHRQVNFLSGKEFDKGEYMFSATYAQNDGFGDKTNGYQNYVHDFESIPWNDQRGNFNHLYPSYEIFGKIRMRDFTIKALASEKSIYSFWTSNQSTDWPDVQDKKSLLTSKDMHLEFSHHAVLTDKITLDTKITAKQIEYIRDDLVDVGTDHGSQFDNPAVEPIHYTAKFPENGVGLEFMLNWDLHEKNKLLAGTSVRIVQAGPAEINYVNLNTGKTPAGGTVRDSVYYRKTRDKTYGAYVEDTYYVTDNITLIGGIRIDYNDPREKAWIIMPRGAAIYKFSDALSVKYMYNTGYVRPQMAKSFEVALAKQGSVKKSEKIRAHDAALIYNTEKTQIIVDAFEMTVYDLYTYDAINDSHVNTGNIWTKGIELSLKRSFLDGTLFFDLNYGYATAKTEDGIYYGGIPNHVYAAGATYLFTDKISLYANVNGWRDLNMNRARATAWYPTPEHPDDYNGEYLVDVNLRFMNLLDKSLDISLYVLNVFDRKARLQALDDWYAWWSYSRGRSIGTKISWKF